MAGGANLINLFDLRPGRAIKVAVASGTLIGAGGSRNGGGARVAAPLAAALALLPEDLDERALLGDCGANALGAPPPPPPPPPARGDPGESSPQGQHSSVPLNIPI